MLRRAVLALALASAGCATIAGRGPSSPQPALPPEAAAYYDYPDHAPDAVRALISDAPGRRLSIVRFPLSVPADLTPTEPVVEFEWFESDRPGRRPAIVFNPILGGDYPLERGICRYLAQHGFHVALIHRKTLKISPEHPVAHLELLLRQGLLRIRQVVDWMALQETVDPQRLGSFGISMGGMASAMTAAVEPRLKAHVVALAGGPIADILMTTNDKLLTKPRRRYLEHNQLTLEEMHRQLTAAVQTDPLRLAPYADRTQLLMFITLFDRTIGTSREFALWRALGRPPAVLMPFGHYTSYLMLPVLKHRSLRFFRKTLGR